MANDVKTPFDEINGLITTITDPEQKELTKAMAVLVAALGVGTDVDLLAQETGYSQEFIFGIATCMREAQLWGENVVDDREWWEGPDEFRVGPDEYLDMLRRTLVPACLTSTAYQHRTARTLWRKLATARRAGRPARV